MKTFSICATAIAATLVAGTARADILATSVNLSSQQFEASSSFSVVLDGVENKNAIKFTTSKAGPVIITFYAECAVDGFPDDWMDIDILVDSAGAGGFVAIRPTNDDNAMCTGAEAMPDGDIDRWVGAVVAGVVDLPKGTHKLRVRAYLYGEGGGHLDDVLVTVQN
jgi:hypothetical protein